MAKMHKVPIGNRFLSLSYHSFMRPVAVSCTQLMRALYPDMVTLWEQLDFPSGGFNCWVLKNSAQYMSTIDDYNASRTVTQHELAPFLWQFDFERLYTELAQADLKDVLADFVNSVYALHSDKLLIVKDGSAKAKWEGHDYNCKRKKVAFAPRRAIALIHLIIDHAYVQVGGKAFKQVQGIPMGTNPACFFADIYLFMSELAFFRRLLPLRHANPTAKRVMHAFRWCGRQLDDLQTVSFEPLAFLQQFIYVDQVVDGVSGIYPSNSIRLVSCNPDDGFRARFTDVLIYTALDGAGPLTSDLYDKRREPNFRDNLAACKYPHADTLLSQTCKANVFTGQFIRFTRIVRNPGNFVCEVANVILCLTDIGYDRGRLLTQCWRMLKDMPFLY